MQHRALSIVLFTLLGCGSDPIAEPDAGADAGPARPPATVGPSERPARFFAPPAHDGVTELPLVLLLHGYTVDSIVQDLYFATTRNARELGFYLLLPDGTFDASGERHWDIVGAEVDDHGYLRGLIEEAMALVPVGPVYVIGHSNGSFMAYRLACDSADLVTGIAGLAGSDVIPSCTPADDVSVLHIHGTVDGTIAYDGGTIAGFPYPGATEVIATWATRLGCTGTQMGADLDLVSNLPIIGGPAETHVLDHTGCRAGLSLWTMEGADHLPQINGEFTPSIVAWLRAH